MRLYKTIKYHFIIFLRPTMLSLPPSTPPRRKRPLTCPPAPKKKRPSLLPEWTHQQHLDYIDELLELAKVLQIEVPSSTTASTTESSGMQLLPPESTLPVRLLSRSQKHH